MKNTPKISILLSSYNHSKYLAESINSVLEQTFTDFELIIYDDGSTDESWKIIESYKDPRIKKFHKTINPVTDWLSISQGEYIAIHHSDDVWESIKLEKQVSFLDSHPDIGAVFSNAFPIGEDSKPLRDETHFYSDVFNQPNRTRYEWLNFFFFNINALCHPSVLIRKNCYEECGFYKSFLAQFPDLDMWVRLCMKYDIHVLPERLVRFRVRKGELNASGDRPETRKRSQFEFLQILNYFRQIDSKNEILSIFPELRKYLVNEDIVTSFALSMLAIEQSQTPIHRLFGLQLLFDCLCDPVKEKRILDLYQFSNRDFISLTGNTDVIYYDVYTDVVNSKAWKISNFIKQIRSKMKQILGIH